MHFSCSKCLILVKCWISKTCHCPFINAWTTGSFSKLQSKSTGPKNHTHTHIHSKNYAKAPNLTVCQSFMGSTCQSASPSVWVWSCLSEVSEVQSRALYKVTTPSKRPGLHKRTFYDSALQKNSLKSSKHTHRERQAVDGKFRAKPTVRQWDSGRERERGKVRMKHKRQREESPQKLFDISHQRTIPASLCISNSMLNLQHEVVILPAADAHQSQPWCLINLTSLHVCF